MAPLRAAAEAQGKAALSLLWCDQQQPRFDGAPEAEVVAAALVAGLD